MFHWILLTINTVWMNKEMYLTVAYMGTWNFEDARFISWFWPVAKERDRMNSYQFCQWIQFVNRETVEIMTWLRCSNKGRIVRVISNPFRIKITNVGIVCNTTFVVFSCLTCKTKCLYFLALLLIHQCCCCNFLFKII